ncbi:MAG: hypothetical protein FRX49_11771 [Trebouxia sp. A1-2]|nr:MAG: hypothetical protein FRX49_11771 [Trebouxia sp. A1-2]
MPSCKKLSDLDWEQYLLKDTPGHLKGQGLLIFCLHFDNDGEAAASLQSVIRQAVWVDGHICDEIGG